MKHRERETVNERTRKKNLSEHPRVKESSAVGV